MNPNENSEHINRVARQLAILNLYGPDALTPTQPSTGIVAVGQTLPGQTAPNVATATQRIAGYGATGQISTSQTTTNFVASDSRSQSQNLAQSRRHQEVILRYDPPVARRLVPPVFDQAQQRQSYASQSSSSSYESVWSLSSSTSPTDSPVSAGSATRPVAVTLAPVAVATPPSVASGWSPPLHSTSGKTTYRFCVFCKSNRERQAVYESHELHDHQRRVTCPYLFKYTCPLCGATGENAHTESYCPIRSPEAPQSIARLKSTRTSVGSRSMGKKRK